MLSTAINIINHSNHNHVIELQGNAKKWHNRVECARQKSVHLIKNLYKFDV